MLARFDSPVSSHASLQSCDCVTRSTNSTSESWILGEVTEPAERLAGDLAGGGVVHGAAASTAAELRDELGWVCIGATMLGRPRALRQMRRRSLVDGGVERSGGEPRSELRLLYVPGPGPGPPASLGWSSLKGSCGGPAADWRTKIYPDWSGWNGWAQDVADVVGGAGGGVECACAVDELM